MARRDKLKVGDSLIDELRDEELTVTDIEDDLVTLEDSVGSEGFTMDEMFAGFEHGTIKRKRR